MATRKDKPRTQKQAVNKKNENNSYFSKSYSDSQGIEAILDQTLSSSYEKLPMMHVIMEKLKMLLTTNLRNFSSESVEIENVSFKSTRFADALEDSKEFKNLIGVFRAIEWNEYGLLLMDKEVVYTFIEILLGGKNFVGRTKSERHNTKIEQTIIKKLSDVILTELGASFEVVSNIKFNMERIETNPSFTRITKEGDIVIVIDISLRLDECQGNFSVVLPYVAFDSIKEQLQQIFIGEKVDQNNEWQEELINNLYNVKFPIKACINDTKKTFIQDLLSLKEGDTIVTSHLSDQDVILTCKNKPILEGQIGKKGNNIAINITKILS